MELGPWESCIDRLATTPEELIAASGSFYNQTMALSRLDLASVGLPRDARIAVVGTPCEIQGLRALQAREWRRGVSRVDAVVLAIALLCTKSFDYRKLMVEELASKRGLSLAEVGKVDVIHGRMIVEDLSGSTLVDEPIKDFHGAALKGCDECADFLGRGADISVGSVGSAAGYSSVIVRTEAGARALAAVRRELEVTAVESRAARCSWTSPSTSRFTVAPTVLRSGATDGQHGDDDADNRPRCRPATGSGAGSASGGAGSRHSRRARRAPEAVG